MKPPVSFDFPVSCCLGRDPSFFQDLNSFCHPSKFFRTNLLRPAAVHQYWSLSLSRITPACSAPYQNFSLPVLLLTTSCPPTYSIFPPSFAKFFGHVRVPFVLLLTVSSTSHVTIPAGLCTPLRSVSCFLSFLVHKSQLFFLLRLEFFTVFPFLHQTVKAGCILQGCIHFCSFPLDPFRSCMCHKSFIQHRSSLCQLICFLIALSDEFSTGDICCLSFFVRCALVCSTSINISFQRR